MSLLASDPGASWQVVGVGDFNGDHYADLLWRNSITGQVGIWTGGYSGILTSNTNIYTVGNDWTTFGVGDFDGDTRADILWRSGVNLQVGVWSGNSDGSFLVNSLLTPAGPEWHIVGTGDFNGDTHSDVLWRNDDGRIAEWLGGAAASFTISTISFPAGNDWSVAGTGDFNGDGHTDILWRNVDGRIATWTAGANGSFTPNANIAYASTDWKIVGVGDVNGDGISDLLWRNDNGAFGDWLGRPDGTFFDNSAASFAYMPVGAKIAAVGDFNRDGYADVLWRDDRSVWSWDGSDYEGGFVYNNGMNPTSGSVTPQNGNPSAPDNHYTEVLIGHENLDPGMTLDAYLYNLSVDLTQYLIDSLSPPVSTATSNGYFSMLWIPGAPGDGDNSNIIVNGGHFLMQYTPFSQTYDPGPPTFAISQPALLSLLQPGAHSPIPTTPTVPGWNRPRDVLIDSVAQDVRSIIYQQVHADTHEYGAYIYQTPNGEIQSSIIREGGPNSVTTRLADYNVPSGATLLGFVHSHPLHTPSGLETYYPAVSDIDDYHFLQDIGVGYEERPDHAFTDAASGKTLGLDLMWRTYTVTPNSIEEYDYVQNKTILPDVPQGTPIIGILGEFIPDLIL